MKKGLFLTAAAFVAIASMAVFTAFAEPSEQEKREKIYKELSDAFLKEQMDACLKTAQEKAQEKYDAEVAETETDNKDGKTTTTTKPVVKPSTGGTQTTTQPTTTPTTPTTPTTKNENSTTTKGGATKAGDNTNVTTKGGATKAGDNTNVTTKGGATKK
jgi:hypothetical protein